MSLGDYFGEFFDFIKKKPAVRKFYQRLPDQQVLDQDYAPQDFKVDQGYFQISLSEMFLQDRREYWLEYVPLGLVLSDFFYQERKTVPFLVGHHLLKELEKTVAGEMVEYHNTELTGPIPYQGGGFGLFLGLCRVQVNDLAENLFGCLTSLVKTLDVPPLATYLSVAQPLYQGIKSLMGLDQVELRFGHRDVFTDQKGVRRFRSGYLAFVNCPQNELSTDNLWIKDGMVHQGARDQFTRLAGYDYCLVKIEHLSERTDYESLPFFATWHETKKNLWKDNQPVLATNTLNKFLGQIATSPDLTTPHRYHLIQTFKANFDKEVEIYQSVHGGASQASATIYRGGPAGGFLKPQAALQKTAHLAEKAGFSSKVVKGLTSISNSWEKVPHLMERPEHLDLTAEIINEQRKIFEKLSPVAKPDPVSLANAIAVASLSASG